MAKRILKIAAFALALILPCSLILTAGLVAGDPYAETYYAALAKQYDRLYGTEGEKVVLLGNSSVAFGIDSDLFEQLYGKPLVAFGLYGSLGTKLMLDLSEGAIGRGDTVVIALEFNSDAYSLNFFPENVLKATGSRPDIRARVDFNDWEDLLGRYPSYAQTEFSYYRDGYVPEAAGVYRYDAINDRGEVAAGQRPGNIMRSGCLEEKILSSADGIGSGFIDRLNAYISRVRLRGAEVCLSFAPVNGKAVEEQGIGADELYAFCGELGELLDCEIVSDPTQYVLDYRYFYDTNFHLNDSGAVCRTVQLVRDLRLRDGNNDRLDVQVPAPPEPAVQIVEIDPTLDYTPSDYFLYKENGEDLSICGVTEEGAALTEIVVPVLHDGKYVTKIVADALGSCKELREITIPVGITEMSSFAFSGCVSLMRIVLLETSGNRISVYADTFSGLNASCKIVLKNARAADFLTGYFWPQVKLEVIGQ